MNPNHDLRIHEFCILLPNRSLLERLYHHYETYQSLIDNSKPLKLPLKLNYRSKMEILRFISAISYGGPHELVARSEQQDVVGVVPLTFYVAQVRGYNLYQSPYG